MDFVLVAKSLASVANTPATSLKAVLLTQFAKINGFTDVLKFIYNPYNVTGIGDKKLSAYLFKDLKPREISPEQIMAYLRQNNTGTIVDIIRAAEFCRQYKDEPVAAWAAQGLVLGDLQIGVSVTTLNKLFGTDFIPTIGIMRGMNCPEQIRGQYIVTEKIDGNRRLIMVKPTGVEIYTRSGRRDTGLVEIEEQAKQLPVGYVYDSECIATGFFNDSIEQRQASASLLNSKGPRRGAVACCFDMIPQKEYDKGIGKSSALLRKLQLAYTMNDPKSCELLQNAFPVIAHIVLGKPDTPELPNIKAIPIKGVVSDTATALAMAEAVWEVGGEGLMLVDFKSPYEVKASPCNTLLKIKQTKEATLECVDVLEGDNKYTYMLGAITVKYTRDGDPTVYYVNVGSGFPDYLRELYWNEPELIVGKKVEIEHSGESKNQNGLYSLSQPRFKRIAGESE